jgi:hypothetical protein
VSKSSEIQAHTDKYQLVGAMDPDTGEIKPVNLGDGTVLGLAVQQYVWNTDTLIWEKAIQPEFSLTGEIKVDNEELEDLIRDQLLGYHLDDYDTVPDPVIYMGYQDKDGNWYIQRVDTTGGATVISYQAGTSGYDTAWSARATFPGTYTDFPGAFG